MGDGLHLVGRRFDHPFGCRGPQVPGVIVLSMQKMVVADRGAARSKVSRCNKSRADGAFVSP